LFDFKERQILQIVLEFVIIIIELEEDHEQLLQFPNLCESLIVCF
jgi:hypothetical protein